jgi:predicted dehydrogenase
MEHGCHVVVEKPMATTVKDCDWMIQTMREQHVSLFVLHTSLFNPAFLHLKEMISKGEVGEVFGVDINYLGNCEEPFIVDANHWSHSLPGGAFCESLPHPLYLLHSLLPKLDVQAVSWQKFGRLKHMKADDLCVLFRSGSVSATMRLGWNSPRNMAIVRVYGTKAIVDCDLHSISTVKHGHGTVSPWSLAADSLSTSLSIFGDSVSSFFKWTVLGWRGGYQELIKRILSCIGGKGPSPINVEDARDVVVMMERICTQIPTGRDEK